MVLPIMIKPAYEKKKIRFINYVESKGLQTRPIISGNFINQPSAKLYNLDMNKKFPEADKVQKLGFVIGLPTKKIDNKSLNFISKILLTIDTF